ncbi:hypothetical protein C8Q80DRAFT_120527 [Daedaleopsis nitida]|nr:hypothetical protein C8Q80DRAFT_120527 [Daedaleopsis nitida]
MSLMCCSVRSSCCSETFRKHEWPRLCELNLRGELQSRPTHAVQQALSHIATLRKLSLELAQGRGLEQQILPPSDATTTVFLWRDLNFLATSYPHPDDNLYSLFPSILRHLELFDATRATTFISCGMIAER